MLQLDNTNTQRGPSHGSDFNQNSSPSIFHSASITNGTGLPTPTTHAAPRNGPPAAFVGLSAGPPSQPHGPFSAGVPQGPDHMGSMIHWGTGSPQHLPLQSTAPLQQTGSGLVCNSNNSNNNNNNSEDDDDDDYRPFTPPPPRERLSYTRYQLELLNGIYNEVRYPNSTQKQLIAKRVGITREQVKIWFQNRRRKDVVSKGGKPDDKDPDPGNAATTGDTNSNGDTSDHNSNGSSTKQDDGETDLAGHSGKTSYDLENGPGGSNSDCVNGFSGTGSQSKEDNDSSDARDKMVSTVVLNSIVAELQKFNNEYLKQKKNRKKSKSKSIKHAASMAAAAAAAANSSAAQCKAKRLFQSYDMIAPPNKVTPSAFLNTSANRFKHAGGTSAFQNPRENRLMPITPLNLGENRLWDGFALTHGTSFPSPADSSDLLQQRSPAESSNAIPAIPSSLAQPFGIPNQTSHQQAAAFGGLLSSSMAAVHHLNSQSSLYDNLPVLSDLLTSYKNQQSASVAAAVAHRQQLEHSLLSSTSGSPGRPPPPSQSLFHLPRQSSSGSLGSSGGSSSVSSTTHNGNNTSDDSSKSPLSDLTFPSPTAPPAYPFPFNSHHPHHPHSSPFALNRVFPFPLIADPPVMLSTIRQSDSTFRTHPPHQWPHPPSPLGQSNPPVGVGHTFGSSQISSASTEDPYRPLLISSLNNPYFSPSTSSSYPVFASPSLPPPSQQQNWSGSPPGTGSTEFAQL